MKIIINLILFLFIQNIYCFSESNVFVSIQPIAYFVNRIAVNLVNIETLVGPGQNHESFSPNSKQISKLSQAQIFFRIGLQFEETLIPKILQINPKIIIKDLRENIKLINNDPHIWLSPLLVIEQAKTIKNTFITLFPNNSEIFETNCSKFIEELKTLNERLLKSFVPYKGMDLFVFHPAFSYFANDYGLNQVAVELNGKEPPARMLARLIDLAKSRNVKIIFYEPQFSKKTVTALANEIGAQTVSIDPMVYDYINNLNSVAEQIQNALNKQLK